MRKGHGTQASKWTECEVQPCSLVQAYLHPEQGVPIHIQMGAKQSLKIVPVLSVREGVSHWGISSKMHDLVCVFPSLL